MTEPPQPASDPGDPYGRTPAELAAVRRKQRFIAAALSAVVVAGIVAGIVLSIVVKH